MKLTICGTWNDAATGEYVMPEHEPNGTMYAVPNMRHGEDGEPAELVFERVVIDMRGWRVRLWRRTR